ncbi:MAG TPA: Uma2 family endonuclease [Bryobacteraceae bacterium]|jgi:Uma2 family endonuclease|nr:Uma2 family endonuclease [Bryobacteraceae bacterium]
MAVAPTIPRISAEEYLNSGYHPEMEYVDGVLVERAVPTVAHSLLQLILCVYLDALRTKFEFEPLPEVRAQIIEGARYRVPDVMLCPVPLPAGKIVDTIPWVVIEILSPDDRLSEQLARFRDYKQIGVLHMVLLDPEELTAYRFENRALIEAPLTSLTLPTGDLPFDTEDLFRRLVERRHAIIE